MEINVEKYLDEEEIKEIVKDVIYNEVIERVGKSGLDTMVNNMAYNILISVVSEQAWNKFKDSLIEKMEKAVTDNMAFYAFYEWRHLDKLMKDTIQSNRELLSKHMIDTFMSRSYDEQMLDKMQRESEDIMWSIYNVIWMLSKNNPTK